MTSEQPWWPQARALVDTLKLELGDDLGGVYVHGSAALGGWVPTSDLDVLAVASDSANKDWRTLGSRLLTAAFAEPIIEMSIVTLRASTHPMPPWPFLVHVAHGDDKVILDVGHGDQDLLMHYLVARRAGLTLVGPAAGQAFGEVPRSLVLPYLSQELVWGLDHADAKYAVLNACRAVAYAVDNMVLSKVDGGRWALGRGYDSTAINRALEAQRQGFPLGTAQAADRDFVDSALATLVRY